MRVAIEKQVAEFQQHQNAVADLLAIVIGKKKDLARLMKEKGELEEECEGAVAVAKEIAAKMQAAGKSVEEIQADPEYMEALTAYQDNQSTLTEKNARITDLQASIAAKTEDGEKHKLMLQKVQREIQALKEKAAATKSEMYANRALTDVNQRLSKMSERGSDKALEEVFAIADGLEAKAQVTGEIAGNDTTVAREKFKAKAQASKANDAFAGLVGIAAAKDKAPAAPAAAEKAGDRLP